MSKLRVLLTAERLSHRGGAALYLGDVALGLLRKGHRPVVYSPELGDVADELRAATIPVVSNLADLAEEPDVIHGQNHRATITALLHFSRAPAVFICHSWQEALIRFPRILRYVAVDDVCYDHLVSENGIAPDRVKLILNFADLRRFKPRRELPATPKRALIFSNGVSPDHGLEAIREACTRANLELDSIGYGTEAGASNPEDVLPFYDIVFAKARCAIEAMAVGCAVVACDVSGLAGMVTTENLPELRRLNFGRRSLSNPLDPTLLYNAIRGYSAQDAGRVSKQMRAIAGLDDALGQLIHVYEDVIREHRRLRPDPAAEMRSAATYVSGEGALAPPESQPPLFRVTHRPTAVPRLLSDELQLSLLVAVSAWDPEIVSGRIVPPPDNAGADCGVFLETAPVVWQYAAVFPISRDIPADKAERPAVLRLRLRVHSGEVGVGLLNQDRTAFVVRSSFAATRDVIDFLVRIERLGAISDLILQTWQSAEESLIEVRAIDVYLIGASTD